MSDHSNNNEANNKIYCKFCGRLIGKYHQVGDQVHIKIGNVILYKAHGSCVCGAEYHFLASELALEQLIVRIRERVTPPIDQTTKIIYNLNS